MNPPTTGFFDGWPFPEEDKVKHQILMSISRNIDKYDFGLTGDPDVILLRDLKNAVLANSDQMEVCIQYMKSIIKRVEELEKKLEKNK